MAVTKISPPLFNEDDAQRAHEEWGANCGPGAAAAILRMSLDQVRPHFEQVGFFGKRYTNFPMMKAVLESVGVIHRKTSPEWPSYGLCRIQWEGPWTAPNVPANARLRYTHWVGAATRVDRQIGIFDINAINNGTGWSRLEDWSGIIVPWILSEQSDKRANGKWHITHTLEVDYDGECA